MCRRRNVEVSKNKQSLFEHKIHRSKGNRVYSEIVGPTALRRHDVEAFIYDRYWCTYQATLDSYSDCLLTLFSDDGRPLAAAGLRGQSEGFFSERYLDEPIDLAASRAIGLSVERTAVLEIANLACANSHAVFPLMSCVLVHGRENGYSCGVFTATSRLRRIFRRLNLPLTYLGPASLHRVEDVGKWGTYYAADPKVCVLGDPAGGATDFFPRCKLESGAAAPVVAHYG